MAMWLTIVVTITIRFTVYNSLSASLYRACRMGRIESVKWFVKNNVDGFNVSNKPGIIMMVVIYYIIISIFPHVRVGLFRGTKVTVKNTGKL